MSMICRYHFNSYYSVSLACLSQVPAISRCFWIGQTDRGSFHSDLDPPCNDLKIPFVWVLICRFGDKIK